MLEEESRGNPEIRRRQSRRMRDSRKLEEPSPAPGRCRLWGNPETHRKALLEERRLGETRRITAGTAEGCGIRGNSMNHRRKSRKMQNSGRPEDCIERRGRTVEDAGRPGDLKPATPKDVEREETRRTHRRHSSRDAGSEETRSLIAKLNGTIHGPNALRVHTIEAPETPVSGVFVFALLTPNYTRSG
jgi:hypothetical protein